MCGATGGWRVRGGRGRAWTPVGEGWSGFLPRTREAEAGGWAGVVRPRRGTWGSEPAPPLASPQSCPKTLESSGCWRRSEEKLAPPASLEPKANLF